MRSPWALAPLLFLLASSKAFGQDDSAVTTAYEIASQGFDAFKQGDPQLALERFNRAYPILKLPKLAVYMARSHVELGHYTQATALYAEAMQLGDGGGDHEAQERARNEAKQERQQLLARMPRLVVQTPGVPIRAVRFQVDGAEASSDELAAGKPVDPGNHQISAVSGTQRLEQAETIQDGASKTIVFKFQPEMPKGHDITRKPEMEPGSKALRNATWVSFGIGGAGLAVWGTTGIWALVKARDLDKSGPWDAGACQSAPSPSECDSYRHLKTVSTIGFYTGLVGVATGAVLLVAAPARAKRGPTSACATPYLGFGIAGIQGNF